MEFGLIALPFFALLTAIIEVAMVFFAIQVLDNGVNQTARLIRTGQVQDAGMSQGVFRDELCQRIDTLFNCGERLSFDVRTFDNFGGVDLSDPLTGDNELDDDDFRYDPGDGGDIVVVRVFYEWPTMVPSFGIDRGELANGNRLLSSTATFRNEPF
ncbi:MAG: TadE family protein [Pseudomonadota bacterium]